MPCSEDTHTAGQRHCEGVNRGHVMRMHYVRLSGNTMLRRQLGYSRVRVVLLQLLQVSVTLCQLHGQLLPARWPERCVVRLCGGALAHIWGEAGNLACL
jgi:hypothetical protein